MLTITISLDPIKVCSSGPRYHSNEDLMTVRFIVEMCSVALFMTTGGKPLSLANLPAMWFSHTTGSPLYRDTALRLSSRLDEVFARYGLYLWLKQVEMT